MDWLDAFREHLTEVEDYTLNPPAIPEEISDVENALATQERIKGFRFPESFRAFLLRYNGGSLYDSWGDEAEGEKISQADEEGGWIDVRFFNVSEAERSGMNLMEYNSEDSVLMDHEIETYFNFEPLVIFAADTGSNFWGFDPRQKRLDGEMPVRFCDHETGDVYEQSHSFVAFVEGLTRRKVKVRSYGNRLPDVVDKEQL